MRVAALYDIHGNLPALEAVIAEVRRADVDRVVVGGDVIPGPMPRETLAHLLALDLPVEFIRGNGESAGLALLADTDPGALPEQARQAVQWSAEQLQPDDRRRLASWPATLRIEIPGLGDVPYDLAEAAGRIGGTSYPGARDFAAQSVLQPPSEEAMLEVFRRVESS